MPVEYTTPHHKLPAELRNAFEEVGRQVKEEVLRRMNTPHPDNPDVPSFVPIGLGRALGAKRREMIDKWNREHPDGNEG
jgi:hypothetical protein